MSDDLVFDSHFESGNLQSAHRIKLPTGGMEYELSLYPDPSKKAHVQWCARCLPFHAVSIDFFAMQRKWADVSRCSGAVFESSRLVAQVFLLGAQRTAAGAVHLPHCQFLEIQQHVQLRHEADRVLLPRRCGAWARCVFHHSLNLAGLYRDGDARNACISIVEIGCSVVPMALTQSRCDGDVMGEHLMAVMCLVQGGVGRTTMAPLPQLHLQTHPAFVTTGCREIARTAPEATS